MALGVKTGIGAPAFWKEQSCSKRVPLSIAEERCREPPLRRAQELVSGSRGRMLLDVHLGTFVLQAWVTEASIDRNPRKFVFDGFSF